MSNAPTTYTSMKEIIIENRMLYVSYAKCININQIRSVEYVSCGKCDVIISSRQIYRFNVSLHEMLDAIARAKNGEKKVWVEHEVSDDEKKSEKNNSIAIWTGIGIVAILLLIAFISAV